MGEALDKVKKNLGLGEKPPESNPGEKVDPLAGLKAAIDQVQDAATRRLLLAQAEELASSLELKARENEARARAIPPVGGASDQATEKAKIKQEITANAIILLEKGVDPAVVGQYMMGSSASGIPITLSGGGQQGLTLQDVKSIVDMMKENLGTSSELKSILERLTDKVEALGKGDGNKPPEPPTHYVVQADGSLQEIRGSAPIIIKQPAPAPTIAGESLEVVKEKNRHAEKMEEISVDRGYKEKITEIAGDAFENIGKGLASQVMESAEAEGGGEGTKLEYFVCPEEGCGTKIPVTPETQTITCPKCKGIYSRKAKTEEGK